MLKSKTQMLKEFRTDHDIDLFLITESWITDEDQVARLRNSYGIKNTALEWFKSYISNRTLSVVINDADSD